ncbi:SEC14-like protein 2 [Daphnia pulicaria]|uniref:SEC14-like protein 2 n=1 Tax=Daphnia pulicaria TaxID=35523 RepID=UPI001EE9C6F1|nr:SEC14-like protein 2 [Daphnia pulicaria]
MDLNQFNEKQKAVLKQFREALNDCQLPDSEDVYLIRWLIARDFDLARAEKMLRNSIEWRRKFKIDALREELKEPEVLSKYFPAGFVGRDKFFNPLWLVRYGKTDMKGILRSTKKRDYVMKVIHLVESSIWLVKSNPETYRRSPDAIVQSTIIFDMEGFTMQHITNKQAMESAIKLIQVYEANYPEYLHRVFVINAPTIFAIGFSMIKPFLNERTRNKIQIFNHDIKQWKAALLTEIDAEELPACYGGKKTDPDGNPNCATLVNMGGVVPKSYYFSGKSDTTNKTPLTVANGSKEHLEFQVKRAGDVLKWDFHTEEGDIAFALYKKQDGELNPIVHFDRVDCDMSTEEGELQCDDTGVYVVEFDNNFSYLRSKKIWYSIKVESATARVNGTDLDSP